MNKVFLTTVSLIMICMSTSLLASEITNCASSAITAAKSNGDVVNAKIYNAEIEGLVKKDQQIVYYFNLEQKKIAVVRADIDCRLISVSFTHAE
jgi:hypothetical protein